MKILIKNARVINPADDFDGVTDLLIENSKIVKIEKSIDVKADQVIDARNKIVMPGIVDMHVHLREPGREDKETIATGTLAALKGGVTSVLAMPNTAPAIDSVENVKLLKEIIEKTAKANVFISGAITKGRSGKEIVDIEALKKESVIAITDDGTSVEDEQIFLSALKSAKDNSILVICHCEDKTLSLNGVMNYGRIATRLGLRGISNESEYKRIQRDIKLAQKIETPIHIAHVSCAESVEIIAKAKKQGAVVTAETAPHYFSLTEDCLVEYDTNMKMNPPLRSKKDLLAIIEALKDGTIDAIASDHAPHTISEKDVEFDRAEFGIIGLETELSVAVTYLINENILTWIQLAKKLSYNPAKILGIEKGDLSVGKVADIIIIDPEVEWEVSKDNLLSKSKNSPYIGKKLFGLVDYTILGGEIVYKK